MKKQKLNIQELFGKKKIEPDYHTASYPQMYLTDFSIPVSNLP